MAKSIRISVMESTIIVSMNRVHEKTVEEMSWIDVNDVSMFLLLRLRNVVVAVLVENRALGSIFWCHLSPSIVMVQRRVRNVFGELRFLIWYSVYVAGGKSEKLCA